MFPLQGYYDECPGTYLVGNDEVFADGGNTTVPCNHRLYAPTVTTTTLSTTTIPTASTTTYYLTTTTTTTTDYLNNDSVFAQGGNTTVPFEKDVVQRWGDPRFQNVKGEIFDVWKLGNIELLRVPMSKEEPALLLVQGIVSQVTYPGETECHGPVISALDFSGAWMGTHHLNATLENEDTSLKFNADMQEERSSVVRVIVQNQRLLKFHINKFVATVEPVEGSIRKSLKFVAKHVSTLPGEIGGLLGMDDHMDASLRPDACFEDKAKQTNMTNLVRSDMVMAMALK